MSCVICYLNLCVGELFWVAQMSSYNFGFGWFSINLHFMVVRHTSSFFIRWVNSFEPVVNGMLIFEGCVEK